MELGYRIRRLAKAFLGFLQWQVHASDLEQQIYWAVLAKGDVCFDIGANVGDVSRFLARCVGPTGQVFSFEPVFDTYREQCSRLQADPYLKAPITTLPLGLSDAPGTRIMSTPDWISGLSSLARPAAWDAAFAPTVVRTHECDFTTLDHLLVEKRYPEPDFIKIDVEGAELLVLRGCVRAFGNGFKPLMLIELFAPWEEAFGYGPWDVLDLLLQLNYKFFFVCPGGLVPHVPTAHRPYPSEYAAGDKVIAYHAELHAGRISRLETLRLGRPGIMSLPPPPIPNRVGGLQCSSEF